MVQSDKVPIKQAAYTRTDFVALRAHIQGIPVAKIAEVYYSEDAPQLVGGLDKYLAAMRHDLIERAMAAQPALAESLKNSRDSAKLLSLLIDVSKAKLSRPSPSQPIAQWFRPRMTDALRSQGIRTMRELLSLIEIRGHRWWRPIPRLGALKARSVIRFLQQNEETLGVISPNALSTPPAHEDEVVLTPESTVLVPLERISLPPLYDGTKGSNRYAGPCFIAARDDLEAINSYLDLFRGSPSTFRAYRKELERFLAWCIKHANKPFSSIVVKDCSAYMRFLEAPDPLFCGAKAPRASPRWRPFGLEPLSVDSRAYAVQILTAAFAWLTDMRYLAGNPWKVVKPPKPEERENEMHIEKALPQELWEKLLGAFDEAIDSLSYGLRRAELNATPIKWRQRSLLQQFRVARAAILLMGDSGLRRAEVAGALRSNLAPSTHTEHAWELRVLGKRNKWRTVPVSNRTVAAIWDHWQDRPQDIERADAPLPLLAPMYVPNTSSAKRRYGESEVGSLPYSPNALAYVVLKAIERVVSGAYVFSDAEARLLRQVSAHDLRHTFGTQMVAAGMPLDVAQKIMGHASLATISAYVQAKMAPMEDMSV